MNFETQTYKPNNSKVLLLLLASLVFVVVGVFILKEDSLMGWFATLFFGICVIVFMIQLIPGSTSLTLTEEGFEVTSLFRKSMTQWTEIESFKIGYLGSGKTVVFDYHETHKKHRIGKLMSKGLSGSHGALPSNYGLEAYELREILSEWKKKFGTRKE